MFEIHHFDSSVDVDLIEAWFVNAASDGNTELMGSILEDSCFTLSADVIDTVQKNVSETAFGQFIRYIKRHPSGRLILN